MKVYKITLLKKKIFIIFATNFYQLKIIRDLSAYKSPDFTAVSIGMFDGVHLGHQSVISLLKEMAKEKNLKTALLSFWPHPRKILNPELEIHQLNTLEEKETLLEKAGVELLFLQEFSEDFRNMDAEDFVKEILVKKIKAKYIVIGHDHSFGKGKKGNFELLQKMGNELGFEVEQLEEVSIENQYISSTEIRQALLESRIKDANRMLGYYYNLSGEVIHGKKLGRKIGFPTANLKVDSTKLLPKKGAYIVEVWIDNQFYKGMLSIGTNPTVGGEKLSVEVYILDFDKDIYGKKLTVNFKDFLHEEIKFDNLDQLIQRLNEDKKITENYNF